MVHLIIVQQGSPNNTTKPPSHNWVPFIIAEIILLAVTLLHVNFSFYDWHHSDIKDPIKLVLLFPAHILLPLALIWTGMMLSPVDKRKTTLAIGGIICLFIVTLLTRAYFTRDITNEFSNEVATSNIIWALIEIVVVIGLTGSVFKAAEHEGPTSLSEGFRPIRGWVITALAIGLFMFITLPGWLGARRAAWMPRAKGTLRSTASSQLAFQGANEDKRYGTFYELQESKYIAGGYSLGNMIENYSMTWEVNHVSTVSPEGMLDIISSTFTIVAYPRDTRPGFLTTFGVTDDQEVRVYNPENASLGINEFNGFQDPRVWTWDPIL